MQLVLHRGILLRPYVPIMGQEHTDHRGITLRPDPS